MVLIRVDEGLEEEGKGVGSSPLEDREKGVVFPFERRLALDLIDEILRQNAVLVEEREEEIRRQVVDQIHPIVAQDVAIPLLHSFPARKEVAERVLIFFFFFMENTKMQSFFPAVFFSYEKSRRAFIW